MRLADAEPLRDFTVGWRLLPLAGLAVAIGLIAALVSRFLLALIGFFTNLLYYQRVATALVEPGGHHLGAVAAVIPVAGGLVVGLMARYGSERIRGHGIPEALESILVNGSRVEPRLAVLKPISAAIAIGSGGPFGAEGPIIMTGGAFGSLVAQLFALTAAERKTLLAAGAAGGMAATFAAPVASALLAVELLLFEWKPRSIVPVVLASATAAAARDGLFGPGPLFPMAAQPVAGASVVAAALPLGLAAGVVAVLLTRAVYATEDGFKRLPLHWMWWPALGAIVVGLGGLVFPRALGVGYATIADLLRGEHGVATIAGLLVVKPLVWVVALGSGTSGGVLAPILLVGGALGAAAAPVLPAAGVGLWALVGMAATLAATMGIPFTAAVFAVELTAQVRALPPLLVATSAAYGLAALLLRRSILTEKVTRRGYHVSREYAVDPLEILTVAEVMRRQIVVLPADAALDTLAPLDGRRQRLYPVTAGDGRLLGVVAARALAEARAAGRAPRVSDLLDGRPVVAHPGEPLRAVAHRMAETGLTRFPVVGPRGRLVGMIALADLLAARQRHLEDERRRERTLPLRLRRPRRRPPPGTAAQAG
jgi:CIC family chloride channel protein